MMRELWLLCAEYLIAMAMQAAKYAGGPEGVLLARGLRAVQRDHAELLLHRRLG